MARFSVGGDEDGNEERTTNRPPPKRPRLPTSLVNKRPAAAANLRYRPNSSTAASAELVIRRSLPLEDRALGEESERQTSDESGLVLRRASQPENQALAGEESERRTSDESDTSWSDTSTDSSYSEDEEDVQVQQQLQTGGEVQLAEARADLIASGCDVTSGSISVTLSDPDVLDCPICYEPLCSPVYQCENGHIACASCCTTMKNKCATCCWPIGYNRCRAIEKVLESVKINCRHMRHGCKETFSYSKRLAHEKVCIYTTCSCPLLDCVYIGMSKCVYAHFALQHPDSSRQFRFNDVISISLEKNQKVVFLQERILNTLFILNRSVETVGSYINVVCVAPPSEKRAFLYDLTATVGESSVRLKSFVDVDPTWVVQPPTKVYLIVPSHFISSSGQLKLELVIRRNAAHPN